MSMTRIALLGATAAALFAASPAVAQTAANYPTRNIKIIVGYAAGGGTDIVARMVAQKMQESFGHSVVVENRPGANGMLGPDVVAKATPDGYTLLFGAAGQMAVSPAVYPKIPYQTLKNFVPVSMMTSYPLIMIVNSKHPAGNLKEFIAWAKANPDKTNYASASAAFTLTSELLKLKTGTPGQVIPFKSSNESVTSVVGDQVTYTIAEPPPIVAQVSSGRIRALAVAAPKRLPELPDVPTMTEAGCRYEASRSGSGCSRPQARRPRSSRSSRPSAGGLRDCPTSRRSCGRCRPTRSAPRRRNSPPRSPPRSSSGRTLPRGRT